MKYKSQKKPWCTQISSVSGQNEDFFSTINENKNVLICKN